MEQLKLFEVKDAQRYHFTRRKRRNSLLNLDLTTGIEFTEQGMPQVKPCYFSQPPTYWQLFSQAVSNKTANRCAGVLFFQDDYKFERVWSMPQKYCKILKQFPYVASPDFSLYVNMPLEMQRWNVYRNRLVASFWQTKGIPVIPTMSWSTSESHDFCFDGVYGGTVMISTVGVLNNTVSRQLWCEGAEEMIYRVKPDHIIIYGRPIIFDFRNIEITYIEYIYQKGGMNYGR